MSCEDFYLHLSSSEAAGNNAANFSINLPTPKSLPGSWRVALKEIHFTHSPKQSVESEPISFLILGTAGNGDALVSWRDEAVANKWAEYTPASTETEPWGSFPNFPYAIILTYYKRPAEGGRPATYFMTPGGQYDSINRYIEDLNDVLRDMERTHLQNLHGRWPMYFTYTDSGKVNCVWNYCSGYWNRLFVFPILGEKTRELLGLGNIMDKDNMGFRNMIGEMIKREDYVTHPFKHRLTHVNDNILVLANIVEQTGGSKGEIGKILRVIENPGKYSTLPLVHLYLVESHYIKVPLRNFHNVQIRLISASTLCDLTMSGTTTVVLHFIPQNECEEPRKIPSIPIARHGSSGRRDPSSVLSLDGLDHTREEYPGEPINDELVNAGKEPPMRPRIPSISTSHNLRERFGHTTRD
jgi:hypothetical protein